MLGVLVAGGAMDLLDGTIVNVAIPSISRSLHSTFASVEWTVSGYLLAFAVLLITGSRLGDRYGRRRMFELGVAGFIATSVVCATAPTATLLVVGRMLQGLSAAVMVPQILATVQTIFPEEERQRAVGAFSAVAGLAVMSGPLLAGALIAWNPLDLSWRAIFLVNVPIGLAVLAATRLWVPETRQEDPDRLDLVGVALVSATMFAVVFGLISAHQEGWGSPGSLTLAAALPLGAVFARWEIRSERTGGAPVIPLSLLRERGFALGTATGCAFFSAITALFLSVTIFLQLGHGFSALTAASTTIPSAVGLIIAGALTSRFESRALLVAGPLLMAAAVLGMSTVIRHQGPDLSPWELRPVIFWFGFGTGLVLPRLARLALASVRPRNAGAASGVLNTGMQLGSVLGIVVTGMILFGTLRSDAPAATRAAVARADAPRLEARARDCVVARSHERQLDAVPAECAAPRAGSPALFRRVVTLSTQLSFVTAIRNVLIYEAVVLGAVAALLAALVALQRGRARPEAVPPGSEAPELVG